MKTTEVSEGVEKEIYRVCKARTGVRCTNSKVVH